MRTLNPYKFWTAACDFLRNLRLRVHALAPGSQCATYVT